jgi:dephospho-CoA kinase
MLRALGANVLDADAIYHQLVAPLPDGSPSSLAKRIAQHFAGILRQDGSVDRNALREQVFKDPKQKHELEELTHPAIANEVGNLMQRLESKLTFYDVPLLFEKHLEKNMNGVVVVWVPRDVQIARLCARDHITTEEAEIRLTQQMSLDEKRQRATWMIDNSGTPDQTQKQVEAFYQSVVQ